MCKLVSMILTKKKVYFLSGNDSHEEIIEKFKLKEYVKNKINFVRVEITPNKETTDFFDWSEEALSRWTYKVDQDILPDWYVGEYDEKRTREYLPIVLKERFKDNIWNGDLDFSNTNITELPADLQVNGGLDLRNTNITELPAGLRVSWSLYLRDTKITELPAGLHVGGSLYLSNTKIIELPAGLHVGGSLYLSNTNITELPADLQVGGDLILRNTKITKLPADLYVKGDIYKDF